MEVVVLDGWGCWFTEMAFFGRMGELKLTT